MYISPKPLLAQIKARRKALELRQRDMRMRIGMSRQQYQRLESRGNPRLNTLELIAQGLQSRLLLVPMDKLGAVEAAMGGRTIDSLPAGELVSDDPWRGLMDDLRDTDALDEDAGD